MVVTVDDHCCPPPMALVVMVTMMVVVRVVRVVRVVGVVMVVSMGARVWRWSPTSAWGEMGGCNDPGGAQQGGSLRL